MGSGAIQRDGVSARAIRVTREARAVRVELQKKTKVSSWYTTGISIIPSSTDVHSYIDIEHWMKRTTALPL